MQGVLTVGCCGLSIALEKYAQVFSIVELQSTFYQLPRLETAQRWRMKVPENFEFCMKAWQGITHLAHSPTYRRYRKRIPEFVKNNYGHFQQTDEVLQAWEETKAIAEALRAKVIVFQCPPDFQQNDVSITNLTRFFERVISSERIVALELRGTWEPAVVRDICTQYNIVHCVDPFKEEPQYGIIRYYRLHGSPPGPRMYHYQYTADDFRILEMKLLRDIQAGKDVFCFFNNDAMVHDALAFREYWKKKYSSQTR